MDEDCGESRYYLLVVHHRDKDRTNPEEENLATLCYNCHALRHLVVKPNGKLGVSWRTLTTEEAMKLLTPTRPQFPTI